MSDVLSEGGRDVGMPQTNHFLGWTDNMSILDRNVAVVNLRKGRNVSRMNCAGRIVPWMYHQGTNISC